MVCCIGSPRDPENVFLTPSLSFLKTSVVRNRSILEQVGVRGCGFQAWDFCLPETRSGPQRVQVKLARGTRVLRGGLSRLTQTVTQAGRMAGHPSLRQCGFSASNVFLAPAPLRARLPDAHALLKAQ